MNDILEYSIQLAMLRQLLIEKLIDKREYFKIKEVLMKKYNISSDLTCQIMLNMLKYNCIEEYKSEVRL